MNNMCSVGMLPQTVSFKSQNPDAKQQTPMVMKQPMSQDELYLKMIEEQKKKEKKQRYTRWAMTSLQIAALLSMVAIGWPAMKSIFKKGGGPSETQKEMGIKTLGELKKEFMMDVSGAKSLEELFLPKTLNDTTNHIINGIKNIDEAAKKGGEALKTIFLYGPPGTGKTTYVEALAKEINADFYSIRMPKLKQPLHGVSEQNIATTFEMVCKEADKLAESGSDKKLVVFLDEIDSVMMEDIGNGAKLSNDILNQFKVSFNDLLKRKNIIVIGASNLEIDAQKGMMKNGKMLNDAMLSRFKQKVLVDFPSSEQLASTISEHYKNMELVDNILKQKDGKLKEICDLLANKRHETSFRTLESIYDDAYLSSEKGKPVTLEIFINTIIGKAEELKLSEQDIQKLKDLLK